MCRADRWAVLSLGYFSRNRYWGEDESKAYRDALCTSTFIEIAGLRIVIDPPTSGAAMAAMLDQRTGLKPDKIDLVFITHAHADHYLGLGDFPNARLLAAPDDCESIRQSLLEANNPWISQHIKNPGAIAESLTPAEDEIAPGVRLLKLPGHTYGLAGAVFEAKEGVVAVAGDSVMTADHFRERQGYYNSVDFEASRQSIEKLASVADILIPGHSNFFLTKFV